MLLNITFSECCASLNTIREMPDGHKTHVHSAVVAGEGSRGEGCRLWMHRSTEEGVGIAFEVGHHSLPKVHDSCSCSMMMLMLLLLLARGTYAVPEGCIRCAVCGQSTRKNLGLIRPVCEQSDKCVLRWWYFNFYGPIYTMLDRHD